MRTMSTPSRFFPRFPRRASGALLALLIFHTELSIIALIGIILLIGIVKKNAILMIDFAIDAERNEGNSPEQSIYQACLLRFRPIMMTTMAAMFGGLPDRPRERKRFGTSAPTGHRYRGRTDGEPDVDALYHSGRVSLSGSLPRLGQRRADPAAARRYRRSRLHRTFGGRLVALVVYVYGAVDGSGYGRQRRHLKFLIRLRPPT